MVILQFFCFSNIDDEATWDAILFFFSTSVFEETTRANAGNIHFYSQFRSENFPKNNMKRNILQARWTIRQQNNDRNLYFLEIVTDPLVFLF